MQFSSFVCQLRRYFLVKGLPRRLFGSRTSSIASEFTGSSTVDEDEIEKLSRSTSDWWDLFGEFAPLHAMNKLRVPFVRKALEQGTESNKARPLSGFKILDAGCGGGILSEPLARLGADVTGIDASPRNINSAIQHSSSDPLIRGKLQYSCITIEDLADKKPEVFDAVVSSEVIEHVTDKKTFLEASAQLIKPGGSLFITTLNRTQKSYVAAIVGAEYILRVLTPGTHEWSKFITVEELKELVELSSPRQEEWLPSLPSQKFVICTLDGSDFGANLHLGGRKTGCVLVYQTKREPGELHII